MGQKIADQAPKIVLGTVQFGMDYGITNLGGKPSKEAAFSTLEAAWELGVRQFDTAPGYGSEILLGDFIKAHAIQREVQILTKVPALGVSSSWEERIASVGEQFSICIKYRNHRDTFFSSCG